MNEIYYILFINVQTLSSLNWPFKQLIQLVTQNKIEIESIKEVKKNLKNK